MIRVKSNTLYKRLYSYKEDTSGGVICDQTIVLDRAENFCRLPSSIASSEISRYSYRKNFQFFNQQFYDLSSNRSRSVQTALAGRIVFQMDKAASPNKIILRNVGECGQITNMQQFPI